MFTKPYIYQSTRSGGIGFIGLLTLVFVVAKVAAWGEIATWSWWWVFSPLWITAAVSLFLIFVATVASIFFQRR